MERTLKPGGALDRVPSTKSRVGSLTSQTAAKPEKRSLSNTYNKETDSNIFALGDAASQLENLDDLFAGFGFNLMDILTGEGSPLPQRGATVAVDPNSAAMSPNALCATKDVASGEDPGENVVQTTSKTLPDGRCVHTRVVRGPTKCTKRILRISRDTPNGPELISTMEVAPGEQFTLPHVMSVTPTPATGNDPHNEATCPSTTVCIEQPTPERRFVPTAKGEVIARPMDLPSIVSSLNIPRFPVIIIIMTMIQGYFASQTLVLGNELYNKIIKALDYV